jgi:hypothetical protein
MRRTFLAGTVIAGLLSSMLISAPASAGAGWSATVPPAADKIVINVVTVNGSGCPAGSAAVAVAPDSTAFTVSYSKYMAQVGVGAAPTDLRTNCQISLVVHVPQGFTYAIAKADYRGFASLARGASATERANFYFQGQTATAFVSHTYNGPFGDDWQATDSTDLAALVYSPCGAVRNFNINTELRVAAGTSDTAKTTSFIVMDSTDGSLDTTYQFRWATCPK